MKKLDFLQSRKFWAGAIFALASFLVKDGYISVALGEAIMTLAGLFIGVNLIGQITESEKKEKK